MKNRGSRATTLVVIILGLGYLALAWGTWNTVQQALP